MGWIKFRWGRTGHKLDTNWFISLVKVLTWRLLDVTSDWKLFRCILTVKGFGALEIQCFSVWISTNGAIRYFLAVHYHVPKLATVDDTGTIWGSLMICIAQLWNCWLDMEQRSWPERYLVGIIILLTLGQETFEHRCTTKFVCSENLCLLRLQSSWLMSHGLK